MSSPNASVNAVAKRLSDLRAQNAELKAQNVGLEVQNAGLKAQNAELKAQNAELKARLGDSSRELDRLEALLAQYDVYNM
jgi:transposase